MALGTGWGAYLTLATIGGSHPIRSMSVHDASGSPVDISHLMTTKVSRVYVMHDLYDVGGVNMEYLFDSADAGPVLGTEDTAARLTLPARDESAAGYWQGRAYISQINGGQLGINEEHLGQMTLQWLQLPTYTQGVPT